MKRHTLLIVFVVLIVGGVGLAQTAYRLFLPIVQHGALIPSDDEVSTRLQVAEGYAVRLSTHTVLTGLA